jgi:hypothetical protein
MGRTLHPPYPPRRSGTEEARLRIYGASLYWDVFDETLVAGNVDGTDTTSASALRRVTDTGGLLSLDGDLVVFDNTADVFDPEIWFHTLADGAWTMWNAYALLWGIIPDEFGGEFAFAPESYYIATEVYPSFLYAGGQILMNGGTIIEGLSDGELFQFMLVRRPDSAGYFILIRNGANPWRLAWIQRWTPA